MVAREVERVEVVDYDELWPAAFQRGREVLINAIGEYVVGSIQHVGSTSVHGPTGFRKVESCITSQRTTTPDELPVFHQRIHKHRLFLLIGDGGRSDLSRPRRHSHRLNP